jgi:hypothetical protein
MSSTRSKTRQRREQKQATNRSRTLMVGGGIVAVVAVIVIAVLSIRNSQLPDVDTSAVADNSVTFPIQGQTHIPEGSPRPNYNSNPPTSGDHYVYAIPAGFYEETPPDENLVHNLEHGHIWMSYRDTDDTEAISALAAIQEQFPNWSIVTHRANNDSRIVAAAWGRLLSLDAPDEDQILAFIMRYRNQAPESIPG